MPCMPVNPDPTFAAAVGHRCPAEHEPRQSTRAGKLVVNAEALIIRIGFWGMLYYDYSKDHTPPTKNKKWVIIKAPILGLADEVFAARCEALRSRPSSESTK